MSTIIIKINENEHFEATGDVHVCGSIGKGATVIIKNGSLRVDGDIEDNSKLTLIKEPYVNESSGILFNLFNFFTNKESNDVNAYLKVQGNVGSHVTITANSADCNIAGNVGDNCKFNTPSGSIKTLNVGNHCSIKTMSGDIWVSNAGSNSKLNTISGHIYAKNVENDSSLKTISGDVKVEHAHESATLSSRTGNVYLYENGQDRQQVIRGSGL